MIIENKILYWICAFLCLSLIGYFVDFLLGAKIREREKHKIQLFFSKMFNSIDRTNFTGLMKLLTNYLIDLRNCLFGTRFLSFKYIIASFLVSQYLTIAARLLFWIPFYPGKYQPPKSFYIACVPFMPFLGAQALAFSHPTFKYAVGLAGIYWNNYFYDSLTIIITLWSLKIANQKEKYFGLVACFNIFVSYMFAYFCVLTLLTDPITFTFPRLGFFSFIPELWKQEHSMNIFYPKEILFYSLTTFAPIVIYMLLLLFFSLSKCLQWILVTIMYRFADTESEKTVFFRIASAAGLIALLLKTFYEILHRNTAGN